MSDSPVRSGAAAAVVRSGSTGERVRELQARLLALGFDVSADEAGSFDSGTEAAIRTFQALRGIRVDGVCGPETWTTLLDSGYALGDRLLCVRRPMLRGDDVGQLQARLNALGFDAGKEDGILGPNTERALTEFQRNAGITVDGICGRETIDALDRLGTRAGGAVAAARERDSLRDPQALDGRRVYVTAGAPLATLATVLVRGLRGAGAGTILDLSGSAESAVAAAANEFAADLFVAVRPRSAADGEPHGSVTCRCCYYSSGTFASEGGRAIATAVAERVAGVLGGTGAACGRAYTVLRETRMTAIVCEPVVEGDDATFATIAAAPDAVATAVLTAIRDVLERPRPSA